MKYLSDLKIIHRDLASRNLLLANKSNGGYNVKICDFGLSKRIHDETYYYSLPSKTSHPIRWTAPVNLILF
jgi:serine/threonine protein kinase